MVELTPSFGPEESTFQWPGRLCQKIGVHFVRGSGRCENSPAIYRWGSIWQSIQSAKRTVESQVQVSITAEISETLSFSRPFDGLIRKSRFDPSTKVLGYSHSVRFADDTNSTFYRQSYPISQPLPPDLSIKPYLLACASQRAIAARIISVLSREHCSSESPLWPNAYFSFWRSSNPTSIRVCTNRRI